MQNMADKKLFKNTKYGNFRRETDTEIYIQLWYFSYQLFLYGYYM